MKDRMKKADISSKYRARGSEHDVIILADFFSLHQGI